MRLKKRTTTKPLTRTNDTKEENKMIKATIVLSKEELFDILEDDLFDDYFANTGTSIKVTSFVWDAKKSEATVEIVPFEDND